METNPNRNAYPIQYRETINPSDIEPGLTKREYFAAMALQGIIASCNAPMISIPYDPIANQAVEYADALIEALNK